VLRAAYVTGLGTAMLSALGDQQLDCYRASAAAHHLTTRTLTDPELLRHSLQQARRLRLEYDDGEFDPEICCVAAILRDFSGGAIGAIALPDRSSPCPCRRCMRRLGRSAVPRPNSRQKWINKRLRRKPNLPHCE